MITWNRTQVGRLFSETMPGEWGSDPGPDAVPVLRSTNIGKDGELDLEKIVYRSVPISKLDPRRVTQGDILIEKSGGGPGQPAGRVGFVREPFEGTCSNFLELCKVRPEIDPTFAFYMLLNLYQQGRVYKYQQQTTGIINFKLDQYKSEPIQIPHDRRVQSLIASAIDQIREQIRLLEQVIAKQERVRAGLLQALLTRGIDENGEIRNEVRPLSSSLSSFAEINPITAISEQDAKWVLIRMEDVSEAGEWLIPNLRFTHSTFGFTRFKEGDILFAKITPCMENGKGCYIKQLEGGVGVGSTEFHVLRPKNGIDPVFIWAISQSEQLRRKARNAMTGSAGQQRVPAQFLINYPLPPFAPWETSAIGTSIRDIDKELTLTRLSLRKVRNLKAGLMRDLLSGSVSVEPLLDHPSFSSEKMEKP